MYQSTKVIELGSAAFRQWRATHSHCQYVHGYDLTAKIYFEAKDLDERNWVQDFGAFKDFKSYLRKLFDHKLVVAADDPLLENFKALEAAGACELTVLEGGVGCEKFAKLVYDVAVKHFENDRVRVAHVELFEHGRNSACYTPTQSAWPIVQAGYGTPEIAKEVLEKAGGLTTETEPLEQAEVDVEKTPEQLNREMDPLAPSKKGTWDAGTTWV